MLNINEEQLSHMLEALSSGAPPHSGIALGIYFRISIHKKIFNPSIELVHYLQ